MELSSNTRLYAGLVFITIASVEIGGLFLVSLFRKNHSFTSFQVAFFRAGHAHAGVLTILFCLTQLYIDGIVFKSTVSEHLLRIGFGLSAILVPGGFFAAASTKASISPNRWIGLVYCGAAVLALSLVGLGILLVRSSGI